jgi:NADPH2:quinone reductase
VNPVDASNRSDGSWARLAVPFVVGSDASGIVEELGAGVDGFAPGDEVFYFSPFLANPHGSCAELQVVDANVVAHRPLSLTHLECAALPLAAGTAYELVLARVRPAPGESVLIHGAAGGVGGFAVQLAKHAGATVVAVASAPNHPYLGELGADVLVDYRAGDVMAAVRDAVGSVDAVIDLVGGELVAESLEVVREHGRIATACSLEGDLDRAIDMNVTLHGVLVWPDAARLLALRRLVEERAIAPPPLEVYPLDGIVEAHRRVERGHGRGRVVIDVSGPDQ